jgi:hypothetical protein
MAGRIDNAPALPRSEDRQTLLDKLRRERRPQFDYKRPLFQCNDFAVKKRTMLKNKGRQSAN